MKDPRRQFNDKEKNEVKLAFDSNRQKDPMYHKGKITAKNGDGRALLGDGTYDITYLDGDRDMGVLSGFIRVPPDNREIEPPKYFKGTIKKRNDDGDNFDVAYDNGTSERGVLAAFIRLEETDEGETPTSGGGGPRSPKSPMGPKSPKAVAAEFLQGTSGSQAEYSRHARGSQEKHRDWCRRGETLPQTILGATARIRRSRGKKRQTT